MPSVKDNNGKEWSFSVNVSSVARVKEKVGFDLLSVAADTTALPRLYGDPVHLIDCLFWLCNPSDGTLEKFRELWSGDSIENAYQSVCAGIVDFFPSCRRPVVKSLIDSFTEIVTTARELAPEEIEQMKQKAMQAMTSGNLSGDAPGSSESTPENSPSGS